MTTYTGQKYQQQALRGKYQKLFSYLCELSVSEWRTSFSEIEAIIGCKLPASARRYRPWWANQTGNGHSHALAWTSAGWKTAEVDMGAETLVLRRTSGASSRESILDTIWPVHSAGAWPESLSLGREDIYEDRT